MTQKYDDLIPPTPNLSPGMYDTLITQLFRTKLNALDQKVYYVQEKALSKEEAIAYLSRYLYRLIEQVLCAINLEKSTSKGTTKCSVPHTTKSSVPQFTTTKTLSFSRSEADPGVSLVNSIIRGLVRDFNLSDFSSNLLEAKASILEAVVDKSTCDYPDIGTYLEQNTPLTTFSKSTLFTGQKLGLSLGSELRREVASSDEICFLVSFIRQTGLNLLWSKLEKFSAQGKTLRVITTTYMGATEYKAVLRLARLPHVSVKVSYNETVDRLHAKAYLFLRDTGYHTAYIGSSNLSQAALTDGLEWNLKATAVELPHIIEKIKHTFETYWQDETFEVFVPGRDDERLKRALNRTKESHEAIDYSVLDLMRAKNFQNEILEKLTVERLKGHYRNLVVAATGTGKTVISAFDFKRFKAERDEKHLSTNLLFVAHRQTILRQAMDTFRQVLGDENFGELWFGGQKPSSYQALFASKDSLNNALETLALKPDYFDYMVIDEVHHVAAGTYRKLLDRFSPKILLGLTATPERMDGVDITADFDGRISAEIRLDAALNNQLLVPFHYYGVSDSVDRSHLKWQRGGYVASELSRVFTENDRRTHIVFQSLEKYVPNYRQVKALCFCVDQRHAEFMQAKFTLCNLRAGCLTSKNAQDSRHLIKALKKGEINYLFVVDMFNEGVDIPSIDTVLFLRPTQSLTIYLQQLGRGLRKAEGKEFVTVLDYVGQERAEFNYEDRFRALIGRSSQSTLEEVQEGFPHLPLNCSIELEEKAKKYVLDNINAQIKSYSWAKLLTSLKAYHAKSTEPLTLASFLKVEHLSLAPIYKGKSTWGKLCRVAAVAGGFKSNGGLKGSASSQYEEVLSRAVFRKWLATDSLTYFSFLNRVVQAHFRVDVSSFTPKEQKMLLMFYYDMFQDAGQFTSLQCMMDALAQDRNLCEELQMLFPLLMDRCEANEKDDNSKLSLVNPLKLHATYTKDQIFVALGTSTLTKKSSCREGVERNRATKVEAMFVDIIKDRKVGSNTNYNDFALSPDLFHWESQNKVSQRSPTGQAYIHGTQTMLLFVRQQNKFPEDKTRTMGYRYLGEVTLSKYTGNQPMEIEWKMKTPMPPSLLEYAKQFSATA